MRTCLRSLASLSSPLNEGGLSLTSPLNEGGLRGVELGVSLRKPLPNPPLAKGRGLLLPNPPLVKGRGLLKHVLRHRTSVRPLRRSSYTRLLSCLAVAVSFHPAIARADERPFERVRLAGVFNNWRTADDSHELTQVDGRHELVKFWRCGTYEFKFVFDGTWKRHLGDAGDGRLVQPGRNITLSIPQSAEYVIRLYSKAGRWDFEPRSAMRPHAVIRVHDAHAGNVQLDGSASIARKGFPIKTFTWRVRLLSGRASGLGEDQTWEPASSSKTQFLVHKPGRYEIQLTVSDGAFRDQAATTCDLHHGWRLGYRPDEGPPVDQGVMLPFGDGAKGWTFEAVRNGEALLSLDRATAGPRLLVEGPRRVQTRQGRRYLAKLCSKTGPLISLHEDGWHEFRFEPGGDDRLPEGLIVEQAELVGDFNGWRSGVTPMLSTRGGEVYRAILELPDGVHHYKFLINACILLEDTHGDARFRKPDGTGGFNSGFRVGPDADKLGPARPNHVVTEALKHDPAQAAYFTPISENLVRLTFRALADDVESVAVVPLRADVFQCEGGAPIPMHRVDSRRGFDYWTVQVRVRSRMVPFEYPTCRGEKVSGEMAVAPWLQYAFLITDGWERLSVGRTRAEARPWSQAVRLPFETPGWAKRAVWYQIFPERFRNGTAANDPPRTVPWTHAWSKPYKFSHDAPAGQRFEERGGFYRFIYDRRYGGDLQGIQEALPYLRSLGITAIYLNPIFIAESLHKYDATDFRHIDDFFGIKDSLKNIQGETDDPATWQWSESDKLFLDFLKEAHRLGFKVIIDGVFNHTGRDFWAFRDILKNGKDSPYAGWFEIKSWEPFHFEAWDRPDGALPKLKHDEALGLAEPVREHLFAVTRRWMDPDGDGDPSDGIDGWRLDVASDVNAHFWRPWRKLVKSINPDAYIVAELWEESREWLTGDTFDAVMHYPFVRSCQRFFINRKKRTTPTQFVAELQNTLAWYQPQVNYVLQNLFDSHDTDRVASMFMNPDLEYDEANRIQDNGPNYNPEKPTPDCYKRLKTMVTMQMMYIGAPMVYYGDEVGMYGADDPNCRKPMYWPELMPYDDREERIEPEVYEHYRRMIAIRNTYPALQLGTFEPLLADDSTGILAFARTLGAETIVVVLNNGDRPYDLEVPSPWPIGSKIVRLDDPSVCKLVQPPDDKPKARPRVRIVSGDETSIKVDGGRIRGLTISRHGGAVLARVDRRDEE